MFNFLNILLIAYKLINKRIHLNKNNIKLMPFIKRLIYMQ